jgi:hypothetical protein
MRGMKCPVQTAANNSDSPWADGLIQVNLGDEPANRVYGGVVIRTARGQGA